MIGLRANSAKIKACLRISRGKKKTQAGFWLQYNGCAPEVSLAQMEWRSCLDAGRRCLDTRQGEVRQLHIHLRVKSSPLGRGLGWQWWCWMLVLSAVPCQAACLGSKHERGRRLLPHTAATCVPCGALSLADLVPLGQAGCILSKWAHIPSGCTAPGGAEGCPEAGEPLPPPAPSSWFHLL